MSVSNCSHDQTLHAKRSCEPSLFVYGLCQCYTANVWITYESAFLQLPASGFQRNHLYCCVFHLEINYVWVYSHLGHVNLSARADAHVSISIRTTHIQQSAI